ncbi:MAG: hypothetical protein SGPRY_006375 [Prymnesium sp.]
MRHSQLGGNTKTSLCATIGPSLLNYDETFCTLLLATRAMAVKNHAHVNERIEGSSDHAASRDGLLLQMRALQEEVNRLRRENVEASCVDSSRLRSHPPHPPHLHSTGAQEEARHSTTHPAELTTRDSLNGEVVSTGSSMAPQPEGGEQPSTLKHAGTEQGARAAREGAWRSKPEGIPHAEPLRSAPSARDDLAWGSGPSRSPRVGASALEEARNHSALLGGGTRVVLPPPLPPPLPALPTGETATSAGVLAFEDSRNLPRPDSGLEAQHPSPSELPPPSQLTSRLLRTSSLATHAAGVNSLNEGDGDLVLDQLVSGLLATPCIRRRLDELYGKSPADGMQGKMESNALLSHEKCSNAPQVCDGRQRLDLPLPPPPPLPQDY